MRIRPLCGASALLLAACARAPECPQARPAPPAVPAPPPPAPIVQQVAPVAASPPAPAFEPRIGFSRDGAVGAWLVAAQLDGVVAPGVDALQPRLGAALGTSADAPRWRLATTSRGPLDLAAAFDDPHAPKTAAYVGGVLHLESSRRVLVFLGVDGGASLFVDGRCVLAREQAAARVDAD